MTRRRLDPAIAMVLGLMVCLVVDGHAQEDSLRQRLQEAEQRQSLEDEALKSWHLKLSVELHTPQGKPDETGTIEEWWLDPDNYRREYSFPSYSATELRLGAELLRTSGKPQPPYLLRRLLDDELHPVHLDQLGKQFRLELRNERAGKKNTMDCIVLHPPGVSTVDPNLFPRYCFQPDDTLLLMKRDSVQADMVREAGTFQGKYVPSELDIAMENVVIAHERVVSLTLTNDEEAHLGDTDGLTDVRNDTIFVAPNSEDMLIVQSPPHPNGRGMPALRARSRVILDAVFDSEGKAQSITVLSSPDDNSARDAIGIVRHAKRDPYLVDGKPVIYETLIEVKL